jgi:hypothetical protein
MAKKPARKTIYPAPAKTATFFVFSHQSATTKHNSNVHKLKYNKLGFQGRK